VIPSTLETPAVGGEASTVEEPDDVVLHDRVLGVLEGMWTAVVATGVYA
jgi:hypothetical protein